MNQPVRRIAAGTALVGYLLALANVTLTPMSENPFLHGNAVPLRSIHEYLTNDPTNMALRNVGGNLILLVPLGLYLGWRWATIRSAIATAALVSIAIEVMQTVVPGRVGDMDDILLNVAGAAVAAVAGQAIDRWLLPSTPQAAGGHA